MEDYVKQVTDLLRLGEEEAAVALVKSQRPGSPLRHALGRAILALHRKDAAAVRSFARQAHEAAPDEPLPLHYLLLGHAMAGDLAEAERAGRKAVHLGGGNKSLVALASVLTAAGRPDAAEEQLRAVLRTTPDHREAHKGLAASLAQQSDLRGAIQAYAQAYTLDPSDPAPVASLIDLLAQMGKLLGAMAAARIVREEAPPEVAVVMNLILMQLTRTLSGSFPPQHVAADPDENVRALLASATGQGRPVRLAVASALVEVGRRAEAQSLLAALDEEDLAPWETAQLRVLQGILWEQEGDPEQAFEAFREAMQADPGRGDACAGAVALLLDQAEGDTVPLIEELLASVAPAGRHEPRLLLQEARYRRRLGQVTEVRRLVRQAMAAAREEGSLELITLCERLLADL